MVTLHYKGCTLKVLGEHSYFWLNKVVLKDGDILLTDDHRG